MKKLLLATVAAVALIVPAKATLFITLQDVGTAQTTTCVDGTACDNDGTANGVFQINQNLGVFNIQGVFASSDTGTLQGGSIKITNTGAAGTNDSLKILVGNTGFTIPVSGIEESGSITFNHNLGAGLSSLEFFADPTGANPTLASPGVSQFLVTATPVSNADSRSGNQFTAFSSGVPFSMAELATLNLLGGADVTGFQMTMDTTAAVPGPIVGAGLPGLIAACGGLLGFARRRRQRLA